MVNRLVAVDDNFNLPPEVQAQLTGNFEAEFQTLHDESVTAAAAAQASETTATGAATTAVEARDVAVQAAQDATAPTDIAVDEGIDRAIADGKIEKERNYLENINLQIIGHSYTIDPYPYTMPNGEQIKRVARRIGTDTAKSWGRSGSFAIDTLSRLISPEYLGSTIWTPAQTGICLIQNTINELGNSAAPDLAYRRTWEMGIRGLIDVARSDVFCDVDKSPNSLYSGTWADLSPNNETTKRSLNAKLKYASPANAATAKVNIRLFSGYSDFSIVLCVAAQSYDLADIELTYNDVVIKTFSLRGWLPENYIGTGDTTVRPYIPVLVRVPDVRQITGVNTTMDLKLQRAAGQTGSMFYGGHTVTRPNPAAVFVAKEPHRAGAAQAIYEANIDWYNAKTDEIVADYAAADNVWAVDLNPGWVDATMIGATDPAGFHPNDVGMGHIASRWIEGIDTHITDYKNGVVVF